MTGFKQKTLKNKKLYNKIYFMGEIHCLILNFNDILYALIYGYYNIKTLFTKLFFFKYLLCDLQIKFKILNLFAHIFYSKEKC